ncbi:MAG: hypothetical protein ABI791_05975 [Acidobacteriota bacterium]
MEPIPERPVDYSAIDEMLDRWAANHRFTIQKEYKEIEVRSITFQGGDSVIYQLWIDPPDGNGFVGIHVWDYEKRRKDFVVGTSELPEKLELAFRTIQEGFERPG